MVKAIKEGNFDMVDNLNFVHDIFIFLKVNSNMVEILKWILNVLENLSGLKFNFTKNELIILDISDYEGTLLAHINYFRLQDD